MAAGIQASYSRFCKMLRRRSPFLSVLSRFVGGVLGVSGLLFIADAVVAIAWQEPLSALLAAREQGRLAQELTVADAAADPRVAGAPRAVPGKRPARRSTTRQRPRVRIGRAAGRVKLPTLNREYVFVEGTDAASLRRGPGHIPDTGLPGEGGTFAVAGHRTTYGAPFRTIDRLKPGDPIRVDMPYGRFSYRVRRTRIVRPDSLWVKRSTGREQIILIACHPLYSAARRIVVFAQLDSVS